MTDIATIIATDIRSECSGVANVEERVRRAMRAAHDHWCGGTETDQFRAAIAAAMLESPPEEQERIRRSAVALDRVSAALAAAGTGARVDLLGTIEDLDLTDVLPLRGMWEER